MSSYSSSLLAMSSLAACRPSGDFGSAPLRIEAAMREHILYLYRGSVRSGVPDHRTSAAVVWALHSGVSRKRSQTRARAMCWLFCATSVKMTRRATSGEAHSSAVCFRFVSPRSGKRSSQSTAFGTRSKIRSQVRKVVGSICDHVRVFDPAPRTCIPCRVG
jgi:hypothetical protein